MSGPGSLAATLWLLRGFAYISVGTDLSWRQLQARFLPGLQDHEHQDRVLRDMALGQRPPESGRESSLGTHCGVRTSMGAQRTQENNILTALVSGFVFLKERQRTDCCWVRESEWNPRLASSMRAGCPGVAHQPG